MNTLKDLSAGDTFRCVVNKHTSITGFKGKVCTPSELDMFSSFSGTNTYVYPL